jgi:hypothetical protein
LWARPLLKTSNAVGPAATTVNYQGRIADVEGNPITQSGLTLRFAIYDAPTGGNLIWPVDAPETHVVDVVEGLFSVGLGSATSGGIPTTVWNGDRYLEITVGSQALSPRELIRSVPIAGLALTLPDNTVNGDMLAESGFGSSNAGLQNFVIRGPVAEPDLTTTTEVTGALWDLQPIVGDTAEMVALQVLVYDEVMGSTFKAWPADETRDEGTNAPMVRVFADNRTVTDIIWVRCSNDQKLNYTIGVSGDGTELRSLGVTVIGWVEPATTP